VFIALIAIGCVAAPLCVRKTAASRLRKETSSQAPVDQAKAARSYGELPLSFERNDGQTTAEVKFISRGPRYDLFLTEAGAVLNLRKNEPKNDPKQPFTADQRQAQSLLHLNLKMVGANHDANVNGEDELEGKINYFVGNNPSAWHVNIPTYRKIRYTEIFPGVDLIYYGNRTQLEYDFVLAPRASLASIKFEIDGAEKIKIGDEGDLHLATKEGEVQLRKPQIYQLNVRRTGDLSGVTTVDYATVDGTASARSDYTAAFGTLRFSPGESLKSFTVLITDDNLVEGFESVTLQLSNPVGAIFNGPMGAHLTLRFWKFVITTPIRICRTRSTARRSLCVSTTMISLTASQTLADLTFGPTR